MKKRNIKKYIKKLNKISRMAIDCNDIDKACMVIRISAAIQYHWNQNYTDDDLEKTIKIMVEKKKPLLDGYTPSNNVIMFYDGFGLDTRGLALIYLKALCDLGYSVIYVVPEKARNKQPEITKVTAGKDISFVYLPNYHRDMLITEMLHVVQKYRPKDAFFYTTPDDVEACVCFGAMAERVRRYQINLTDHAFWLGVNAFDYCIEFREYGACISNEYRRIDAENIVLLHYYPYVDKSTAFAGFPFETKGHPILFSGGSIYKTIDSNGTYYEMVTQLLQRHKELIFIYAGYGDRSGLKKLQSKFTKRVFIIDERKDLFAFMKQCVFYLNTYPFIGGLMTQYAAAAGRLPLTLVNSPENSLDGLLLNRDSMHLEFSNKDDLLREADRLLLDDNYRQQEQEKLSIIDENAFTRELKNILTKGKSDFDVRLHHVDTVDFRDWYNSRFTYDQLADMIIQSWTRSIWLSFPEVFFYRKVARKLLKIFNRF